MSLLEEAFKKGDFAITAEMAPPKGTDLSHLIECAKGVKGRVQGVNVTDFQSAMLKATSLATCKVLKDVGLEPVLQITGRDRNRIAIQGELLSAGVFGIENVLALTGDYTGIGDHPGAKPVYDLDSVGILQVASTLASGKDMAGNDLNGVPEFYLGACVTPRYDPLDLQIMKMKKKIKAGAKFFQTQGVYDIDTLKEFREKTKDLDAKIMVGIIPLKSAGMAKYMNKNVPGIYVPDELIDRMKNAEDKVKEGIKISAEFIRRIKEEGLGEGVHIMAIGAEKNIPLILDEAGL
ncbi:methylenetetrahydrofolate reductase [Clostridium luticellarii]|jgi:5,10-methylenetetrahydrofolate reductase|uniref:Methylenetetrahydrofolate reductase n=1 Tax=Clostridium luticellarii TaxID=1691940 RepID=A0A2T0BSV8_9CLOT|nr:methylenetetrahydrofolate reductase [Clostridium luticellarii]MCI1946190.1 methylenetetrahydrofolate reductase [Clostridium luticellarii]MCI1969491.1 methylenetetrahydrofolate reductase [Clostridium luticellarii]MCI1995450.1 methylenetetrahydrofolate reductase [Clostridium luticellarii]MCI2040638.1 methylenetetrahydrofolate reductase [Clostridium luticellarii]PRR86971.1 Bifunctional homocysteine S-methyltransferase/5,10-methylenetetrahydrofolate reductase [Clostridium luticellarii]